MQQLARYSKEFGVINALPNMTQLVPSSILGGKTLQATVGPGSFLAFRLDGRAIRTLKAGKYTIVVSDKSRTGNFHIKGPRLDKKTSLKGTGRSTWTITLRKGRYHYMSDARPAAKGTVRVT